MLALKILLKDAEKCKNYLSDHDLFMDGYRAFKDDKYMYFAVKDSVKKLPKIKNIKFELVNKKFNESRKNGTLKQNLEKVLNKQELDFLRTGHDIIGDIAILEIPIELKKREKLIAKTLLETNSKVKTVLKKKAIHSGVFRTQKMTYLAGVKTKEAFYKENGVIIKLDVEKVYFSIRLSNERKRIAELVKPNENILVMFSGCAPYPLVLSKNSTAKKILGIEINPIGHKYGLENLKLNKITNAELMCGDVHKIVLQLKKKNPVLSFDRIIMPLPKTADEFLADALKVSKKGTVIHFYDFLKEDDFDEAIKKIGKCCKDFKFKFKVSDIVRCGQHSPHIFRICVDFQVN